MILTVTVEYIKYRNDENGYSIVVVDNEGSPLIAVGNFPSVSEGDALEIEGDYVMHPKYGEQFKVTGIKYGKFDTPYALAKYLASGVARGVGEVTANKIVEMFKADTLDVIENHPERLTAIKGISLKKAKSVSSDIAAASFMRDTFMYLMGLGLTSGLAMKIYETYKANTVAVVKNNPYKLVEDVRGVGFLTADEIGRKAGIEANSVFRARAAICYTLSAAGDREGNTSMPKTDLITQTGELLSGVTDTLDEALSSLILERKVVEIGDMIMLGSYYRAEKEAAVRLVGLIDSSNKAAYDVEKKIGEFERLNNLQLNEDQRGAVIGAVNSGVYVVTGGPGTGKTTIIKCMIYVLTAFGLTFALLAPTGRAAKRMEESTGSAASTIHRAIFSSENENDETPKLVEDVVVVDEFSMVDAFLFGRLLASMRPEAKLVIVGDADQLPSVGAGNVLKDIMESGAVAVSRLERIYRQANESLIVVNAHKINRGELPELASVDSDFFFFPVKEAEAIASMTVDLVVRRIEKFRGFDSSRIQVLCPMKNGAAGSKALNVALQNTLNPKMSGKREFVFSDFTFREGDRVMHVVNNYELEWTNGSQSGTGVFNGDSGRISSISPANEIYVTFDDGRMALYSGDTRKQLVLSYAITVHKSQGSEFDVIVLPIVGANPVIMTRNLLYTAITRAKKMAVLVGEKYYVQRMVENDYVKKRYSMLKDFIIDAQNDFRKLFSN